MKEYRQNVFEDYKAVLRHVRKWVIEPLAGELAMVVY